MNLINLFKSIFEGPASLHILLLIIVPGFVILYCRSILTVGKVEIFSLPSYFSTSAVYLALVLTCIREITELNQQPWFYWFGFVFFFPAILGLILGVMALLKQKLRFLNFEKLYSFQTAWDGKLSKFNKKHWVLITLTDGTHFGGYCGSESWFSSDPNDRDIYIEETYEIDGDTWIVKERNNGIYIPADKVQLIEFQPDGPETMEVAE